jgi:prophage regulatory protein
MTRRFLRISYVIERTGLSRSHIYRLQSLGRFPKSINLCGGRAVGWLESDVENWIESRIEQSRSGGEI